MGGLTRRWCWGNPRCTTEHAHNSTLKVWQPKSIKERIDQGVDGDEHEMEISEPVNQLTAASMAEVHKIDHDTGRDITGQEDTQHHQISFGELGFHLYGSLTGPVLFRLAVVQTVDLSNLFFGVLENTYVRENEYEDGAEHCNVGKDESVGHESHKKET